METNTSNPESRAPDVGEAPTRVLVQTKTHLVPGDGYHKRCLFMLDLICQRTWNRDFDPKQHRWNVRGALFGYDHHPCYFLVDHGQSSNDEDITVLWYHWDGKSLNFIPQPLPKKIQSKLKEYPFTRPSIKDIPKPHRPLDPVSRRESIQRKLYSDMSLSDGDVEFLRQHPEDEQWIKDNIESRFWSKLESFTHSPNGKGKLA
ncbi:uncharacterized protein VB005_04620 [Metarhizium brunneum]